MEDKNSSRCGYTHQIVGQKWVPGGALLSRGRVWPVDVPETSCKFVPTLRMGRGSVIMSSGLDWERFGVITGGDEACILPPPTLSEKGVGMPTSVHFPIKKKKKKKMPNELRKINTKIRLHGRQGKGMSESFSQEKLRHAQQKEGGEKSCVTFLLLCDAGWYVQRT